MSAAVMPSTHAAATAMLPTERLKALAEQIAREQSDPTLSPRERLYVRTLLAPIASAIVAELEKRGAR